MRNISIFLLTTIIVTSCASPVATSLLTETFIPSTATKLPTETPSPTGTSIPTDTATPAPAAKTIEIVAGKTTCQGTITEEGHAEVLTGDYDRFDLIDPVEDSIGGLVFSVSGYLKDRYQIDCTDGVNTAKGYLYVARIFNKDGTWVDVKGFALKKIIERDKNKDYVFPGNEELGKKRMLFRFKYPTAAAFNKETIDRVVEINGLNELERALLYPEGAEWLTPDEAISEMSTTKNKELDFTFRLITLNVTVRERE